MARETCPAMLMITSSPAPDSASSVTSVWRLSCHRPTTFALSRTFVHAVLNVVTGRVGSFGCPFAGREDVPLRLALTEPPDVPGGVRLERGQDRIVQAIRMGGASTTVRRPVQRLLERSAPSSEASLPQTSSPASPRPTSRLSSSLSSEPACFATVGFSGSFAAWNAAQRFFVASEIAFLPAALIFRFRFGTSGVVAGSVRPPSSICRSSAICPSIRRFRASKPSMAAARISAVSFCVGM